MARFRILLTRGQLQALRAGYAVLATHPLEAQRYFASAVLHQRFWAAVKALNRASQKPLNRSFYHVVYLTGPQVDVLEYLDKQMEYEREARRALLNRPPEIEPGIWGYLKSDVEPAKVVDATAEFVDALNVLLKQAPK